MKEEAEVIVVEAEDVVINFIEEEEGVDIKDIITTIIVLIRLLHTLEVMDIIVGVLIILDRYLLGNSVIIVRL